LHCLNQCGSDALFDLRKSNRIGVVQFYRHSPRGSSMDWPIEKRQIVPTPENNE
jgi:hypothetical protein